MEGVFINLTRIDSKGIYNEKLDGEKKWYSNCSFRADYLNMELSACQFSRCNFNSEVVTFHRPIEKEICSFVKCNFIKTLVLYSSSSALFTNCSFKEVVFVLFNQNDLFTVGASSRFVFELCEKGFSESCSQEEIDDFRKRYRGKIDEDFLLIMKRGK